MSDSLGLSIGMTNLAAAGSGRAPAIRQCVLTLFDHRAPEVGVPRENPNLTEPGLVLTGFVDRVGDPVPLVAADGSSYRGEALAAEALDAMARTVGYGTRVIIAVPAHWGAHQLAALRGDVQIKRGLAPDGAPPTLISDAASALTALATDPGLPAAGVVALCDFGGSGSSITLVDAAGLAPIGETVRYTDFSGDQIDQAMLSHVLTGVRDAANADPTGTAAVGPLTRLRSACREAKERLSANTATAIAADLPGSSGDIRVTRTELENVISGPLSEFLDTVEETLHRNRIPLARLAAVATVGGGARIPLITAQLSQRLRVPVITPAQPALAAAVGAAIRAGQGPATGAATMAAPAVDTPTSMSARTAGAGEFAANGPQSSAFGALAWSEGDSEAAEPVPYTGQDYQSDFPSEAARPAMDFGHHDDTYPDEPTPLVWYRRPPVLFGLAAALAVLAGGGLLSTLNSSTSSPTETTSSVTAPSHPGESPAPAPPQTVTVPGPDGSPSLSTVPPPPPSSTTESPTTTTTEPTTTTTTQPTPTTTTTQPTTTTAPPPTTTPPPPTTTPPPPTTAEPETPTGQAATPTAAPETPTGPAATPTIAPATTGGQLPFLPQLPGLPPLLPQLGG